MAKPFDITLKHLLENYAADWLRLVGIAVSGPIRIEDADLATVSAQADKVFRLSEPVPWLLHLEVQASYDAELPARTHLYNTLLGRRHGVPVRSVVLLMRKQASGRMLTGVLRQSDPLGREYLRFRYEILRVWRLPLDELIAGGVGTLPLAMLTDEAAPHLPEVIQQLRCRVEQELKPAEAASFWTATYVLMGLRYPPEIGAALAREVQNMEESTTYQAILAKGVAKGVVEGRVEGRFEGRVEAARDLLLDLGTIKLGSPDSATRQRLESIADYDHLKQLTERVLTARNWTELLQKD